LRNRIRRQKTTRNFGGYWRGQSVNYAIGHRGSLCGPMMLDG
jgi:hypothetical protein